MVTPIRISAEQQVLIDKLKESADRFDRSPALGGEPIAIELARALVTQAYELGVPEVAIIGLRHYVNAYDREDALPEHLRGAWSSRRPDNQRRDAQYRFTVASDKAKCAAVCRMLAAFSRLQANTAAAS